MLRDCLQERKLPVVFAQSGSCQQLGEIFYQCPDVSGFGLGSCRACTARTGRAAAWRQPRAATKGWEAIWERKASLGWALVKGSQHLFSYPCAAVGPFAAIPANKSLQTARCAPGCFGHLMLSSLPWQWEMKSVLHVPSSVMAVPSHWLCSAGHKGSHCQER